VLRALLCEVSSVVASIRRKQGLGATNHGVLHFGVITLLRSANAHVIA
jgi:hypothetical protein